jgi:hypothetical protein
VPCSGDAVRRFAGDGEGARADDAADAPAGERLRAGDAAPGAPIEVPAAVL